MKHRCHPAVVSGIAAGLVALVAAGSAVAGGKAGFVNPRQPATTGASCALDSSRSLFITDLSVVEDCWRTTWTGPCLTPFPMPAPATRGAWTFGALMQGVFGTTDPLILNTEVRRWLATWQTDQVINSDLVPARPNIVPAVLQPWVNASGSKILDMQKAPFRLLAIVFRFDLRNASGGYGGAGTAGEGRFIFSVVDPSTQAGQEFVVIFEYGLDAEDCQAILDWANSAAGLSSVPFGFDYNAKLQAITDRFTTIGASPRKPNRSAINQVRTNEIILAFPWELREFRLTEPTVFPTPTSPLAPSTVAMTPDFDHNGNSIIADFINTNEPAILAGTHDVPLSFGIPTPVPFRGGAAPNDLSVGWDGPGAPCSTISNPAARFLFSLNTCQGCHGADDTGTFFYHVFPRNPGTVSALSNFLTGGGPPVTDRCGLTNSFDDIERRRIDLCDLLTQPCRVITDAPAPNFVH